MVCRSATLSIVCASLNPRWTFAQWQVRVDQIAQPERAERHTAAVALYSMNYDFHRPRKSLQGRTPAMAAGIATRIMTVAEIVKLVDQACEASRPKKRGPYKKRAKADSN